jgi:hypothetical protein
MLCAAAALLVLDATGRLSGNLANLWSVLSAWTATLLFCCQPIAQLARNFAFPETVSSLSLATVLLATTGNGMMVPRALFTKDLVWSVGSLWGSLAMGWGNMLCVVMASSAAAGCGPHLQQCGQALWNVLNEIGKCVCIIGTSADVTAMKLEVLSLMAPSFALY